MKKFFSILLIISLAQVGIAYAAGTNTSDPTSRDYIFGLSNASEVNLNQVLFLLAGKDGEPGLPGKDGRDGIDGIDGINGKDGIDGVNGIDGKDGINGIDGINGKDGRDGRDGRDGKDGKDGINGTNGTNGTNGIDGKSGTSAEDLSYVIGTGNVYSCTDNATIKFVSKFIADETSSDFVFDKIIIGEIDTACLVNPTVFSVFFNITSNATVQQAGFTLSVGRGIGNYVPGDIIKCSHPIDSAPDLEILSTDANTLCKIYEDGGYDGATSFTLRDIYTSDFTRYIGFEIYNGS